MKLVLMLLFLTVLNAFAFSQLDPGMIKKLISIVTDPAGAEVFVKVKGIWEYEGTTPFRKEIRIGEKEIKIIKAGYEDYYGKINTQTMKHFSALLNYRVLFTGNPNEDIIGKWDAIDINDKMEGQNYSLPSKLEFSKNGQFNWYINYFSKPYMVKGTYSINTFTTPHIIDIYVTEVYDSKKDSYKKTKINYWGIFKIQSKRLLIIFYDSKNKPRPLKINQDEIQSYKKIH